MALKSKCFHLQLWNFICRCTLMSSKRHTHFGSLGYRSMSLWPLQKYKILTSFHSPAWHQICGALVYYQMSSVINHINIILMAKLCCCCMLYNHFFWVLGFLQRNFRTQTMGTIQNHFILFYIWYHQHSKSLILLL